MTIEIHITLHDPNPAYTPEIACKELAGGSAVNRTLEYF